MIWSCIDKKDELEKQVKLVEEVVKWLEIEGHGRDRYIYFRYTKEYGHLRACEETGISERMGRYWKNDIFGKAEIIGERLGIFN